VNLLLVALLVSQVPVHFSPDWVGVRYEKPSVARSEIDQVPGRSCWASSTGATLAQAGCGLAAGALVAGLGYAALTNSVENGWPNFFASLFGTAALFPAATATGVAVAGRGRGRTGQAFLVSYLGGIMLGAIGIVGAGKGGIAIGWAVGSCAGSLVGYNLR
jgi:hypothetical protein